MRKIFVLFALTACLTLLAGEMLTVHREGDSFLLKSDFGDGYALHRPFAVSRRGNLVLNFNIATLVKQSGKPIQLSHSRDDICPWNLNGTYIGANHGDFWASAVICDQPHGLAESDLGGEWSDARGVKFYVIKIESPTIFWVLSENRSKDPALMVFVRPDTKGALNETDGRSLTKFEVKFRQMHPAVRVRSRRYFCDGQEPSDHQDTECREFVAEEEYDIVATDAILEHVRKNRGSQVAFNAPGLDSLLTQKTIYRFTPDGACVLSHHTVFHRNVRLGYSGYIQAGQMVKGAYARHLYYIPKSLPVKHNGENWDFAGRVDFTQPIKGFVGLLPEHCENPASPPERFVQYLEGGEGLPDVGFVVGYSLLDGCTVPEQRVKLARCPISIYQTHKSYPHAIDNGKTPYIRAGQSFDCLAYRQYFNPNKGYYMHKQGDCQVMYVDFHQPENGKVIPLPEILRGMEMQVVEKSPTVQYQREADGLRFDSTAKYGYCVLKFGR